VTRRLPPGETKRSAEFLEKKGHLVRIPGPEERWVDGELVGGIVSKVVSMVSAHHDKDPMSEGMVEAEISTQLPPPEQHLAQLVVDRAVSQKKLVRIRAIVAIPGRGSAISPEDQSDMNRIQAILDKSELTPPTDKQLQADLGFHDKRFQQLLGFMRRAGSIRKVAPGQHYPAGVLSELQLKIVEHLKAGQELSASGFKDLAGGISRKYAIPLLEYYDREKITLRAGNLRKLHPSQK
jgi:selenocysteine-specific elongation factor